MAASHGRKAIGVILSGTGSDGTLGLRRIKESGGLTVVQAILRRIARRMQFNHIREPGAYIELLRKLPEEAHALADDLLITITTFFRDPEVFEVLEKNVIPKLLKDRGSEDPIRVWSVGCATGEEAYSLAILLAEAVERCQSPATVQIFATDLHEGSLAQAREGLSRAISWSTSPQSE